MYMYVMDGLTCRGEGKLKAESLKAKAEKNKAEKRKPNAERVKATGGSG